MKNVLFILFLSILNNNYLYSQSNTQSTSDKRINALRIDFEITNTITTATDPGFIPKNVSIFIKDSINVVRTIMESGDSSIVISHDCGITTYTYRGKVVMKSPASDIQQIWKSHPSYNEEAVFSEESKIIEGYNCKKFTLTTTFLSSNKTFTTKSIIYYTNQLGTDQCFNINGKILGSNNSYPGVMLYMETQNDNIKLVYIAKSIKYELIDPSTFISSDYTVINPDELMSHVAMEEQKKKQKERDSKFTQGDIVVTISKHHDEVISGVIEATMFSSGNDSTCKVKWANGKTTVEYYNHIANASGKGFTINKSGKVIDIDIVCNIKNPLYINDTCWTIQFYKKNVFSMNSEPYDVNGKLNGISILYEDGKRAMDIPYTDGLMNGWSMFYDGKKVEPYYRYYVNGKDVTHDYSQPVSSNNADNSANNGSLSSILQGVQEGVSAYQAVKAPNAKNLDNLAEVTANNTTLSSTDAIKANNNVLTNSTGANTTATTSYNTGVTDAMNKSNKEIVDIYNKQHPHAPMNSSQQAVSTNNTANNNGNSANNLNNNSYSNSNSQQPDTTTQQQDSTSNTTGGYVKNNTKGTSSNSAYGNTTGNTSNSTSPNNSQAGSSNNSTNGNGSNTTNSSSSNTITYATGCGLGCHLVTATMTLSNNLCGNSNDYRYSVSNNTTSTLDIGLYVKKTNGTWVQEAIFENVAGGAVLTNATWECDASLYYMLYYRPAGANERFPNSSSL